MSDRLGPGSTFAGCRIEAVAGQGGMGVVYRATQLTLGRVVAVKAIAPGLSEDASYRERFKRESQLAAMIEHPNIIPVYEAGESEGTLYLIMRWVDGTDLRQTIAAHRLAPERAVGLLRPVASALGAAHKRGLVHRDVKPANVLIATGDEEREEHVYLTDFGIARRTATDATAVTRTGMFVGTVDYMAPERFIGGKGDSASDIYSFGCLLFEALTGQVPFERPSNVTKVFAHVNDPVPSVRAIVPEIPEPLDALVAKAMAKHPRERFSSAGELTRALDAALDGGHGPEPVGAAETVLSAAATEPTPAPTDPQPRPAIASELAPTAMAATGTRLSPTIPADAPPAPPPSRRGRGLWIGVVALLIAVVLAVAAVIVFGVRSGGGNTASSSEVRTISPGLTKLQTISLGGVAGGVSVGPLGEVWVSLPDLETVARVGSDGTMARYTVGGHPAAIAAGPAGVWVAGSSAGALLRLDELSGQSKATSTLQAAPTTLTVDRNDGSAWAGDSAGNVVKVDPSGSVTGQPAHVAPPIRDLGWGEGWVWAVDGATTGLARISPDGSGGTMTFDTHPGPVSVTFNQGVWTAHSSGNVTRFDPRPQKLNVNTDVTVAPSLDVIRGVENQPSVWTISRQSQTLYRISTQPNAPIIGTVGLASAPVGLAVAESSVWVATADGKLTQIGF